MISSMSKISSKGQVVIPIEVRKTLGIEEGDNIRFIIDEEGKTNIEVVKKKAILNLFGVAKPQPDMDTSDFGKVLRESNEDRTKERYGDKKR